MPRYVKRTEEGVWVGYNFEDVDHNKLRDGGWQYADHLTTIEAWQRYGITKFGHVTSEDKEALEKLKLS